LIGGQFLILFFIFINVIELSALLRVTNVRMFPSRSLISYNLELFIFPTFSSLRSVFLFDSVLLLDLILQLFREGLSEELSEAILAEPRVLRLAVRARNRNDGFPYL
jgi:hypothetical protein